MRELKFRVWNGHAMEHNVTVGKFGNFYVNPENGDGLNPKDSASLTTCTTKYHESTPVMQYTGLKDKSGREIYEGDVLSDGEHNYVISWNVEMATFTLKRKGWAFSHFFKEGLDNETSEVIGNIYEPIKE